MVAGDACLFGDQATMVAGGMGLFLVAMAPPGLLFLVSFVRDWRSGWLDELRLTQMSLAEVIKAKLLFSVLPLLPAYAVGYVWTAARLNQEAGWFVAYVMVAWALGGTAFSLAWAVRCAMLLPNMQPWQPAVRYGLVPAMLASAPSAAYYLDQLWFLMGLVFLWWLLPVVAVAMWRSTWQTVQWSQWTEGEAPMPWWRADRLRALRRPQPTDGR